VPVWIRESSGGSRRSESSSLSSPSSDETAPLAARRACARHSRLTRDWLDHIQRMRAEFKPLRVERLAVDAISQWNRTSRPFFVTSTPHKPASNGVQPSLFRLVCGDDDAADIVMPAMPPAPFLGKVADSRVIGNCPDNRRRTLVNAQLPPQPVGPLDLAFQAQPSMLNQSCQVARKASRGICEHFPCSRDQPAVRSQ
jgi:hypothetical protein